jgi:hypothetical protein
MQTSRKLAVLCCLLAVSGCHRKYVVPETPMPANTILLSQMMRDLSSQPGFTQTLLNHLGDGKQDSFLTPRLADELRKRILGKDWQGLDRFPGWTMREINPAVSVIEHFDGKSSNEAALQYIDLGPYALNQTETISLDKPSTFPPFSTTGLVTPLGDGVVYGDGPNNLAPEHSESQRLADVLNRLAANKLDGAKPFSVTVNLAEFSDPPLPPPPPHSGNDYYRRTATTPAELMQLLEETHTVTVDDARYFANFGHLHYQGKDVMMPFWIDSELTIPHAHGRHLLVPASHAEYEWHIHGPLINADISYYFGIDGKSEWRTMDTLDQPWVLKRNAHEYTGAQAVEVTRLAGLLTVAYMHQHARRPQLPFGGYYTLGVCQDGVSAIEQKMTGHVTLFPNTADSALFDDPRDAEANAMLATIPKDRNGARPTPERVFGSLPTTNFDTITIPGLAADLNATYTAWKFGHS